MTIRPLPLFAGTAFIALLTTSTTALAQADAAAAPAVAAQPGSSDPSTPPPGASSPETTRSTANEQDVIVVTGSRIERREFETVQPTQVINAATISNRGYTNISQALSELPGFGPPGNNSVGAQSSFGPAQSFSDFFSLGTQRTLTLVNGRRFVSSNTATIFGPVSAGSQVDLNNIPTTLVDRVEVVAVGGAPIYGSDAIAGTVNLVLKRDYDGFELEGQYGLSERGDGPDRRVSALVGKNFAEGRGNITLSGEYNKVTGLTFGDREITRQGLFFGTPPRTVTTTFARLLYPQQRYSAFTAGGVPFNDDDYLVSRSGFTDSGGNYLQFGPGGTLVPLNLGTVLRQGYISSGGNGFDLPSQANLLTNSERYIGTALANYEFTDHVRAFGEAWYSHSKGTNLLDQPNYNTALFDAGGAPAGNFLVSINNPYLTTGDRATIASQLPAGQDFFYVGRANTDLTPGRSQGIVETYRFVGGLAGDFNAGERNFTWDVAANYGHSKQTGKTLEIVFQNLLNALDTVRDAAGNIVCRPGYDNGNIATLSATCAPLNIFGQGSPSTAARNYIFARANPVSVNSQLDVTANLKGSLFKIWGGDVKFAVGYEHRREKTNFDPGTYFFGDTLPDGTRTGFSQTIPIDPIGGSYHTNEAYAEITIPVVSEDTGLRFLRTFELDGTARYVKNSLTGGDVTWTAGGRLGFIRDVTFRGNFTRSIRSPAITEVFNPTSQAFDSGQDPCDTRYVDAGPNPSVRRKNCVAAGINVADFTSDYSDFTVSDSISGNVNLDNEKADSWTAGAVIQPRFLPGLNVAVDWVSIHLSGSIESLGGDDILNACYDSPGYPNSFCGAVDRDPTGQITFIREGFFNAASRVFEGLTVTTSYRKSLGNLGTAGLSVNYLYADKVNVKVGTGDINHLAGEIGNPHHSGTANLTYEYGGLNALVQLQYYGKSVFEIDEAATSRDIHGVGDWFLWNATLGYDLNKQFGVKLIVDNVFDKEPPYPYTRSYNATQTYFAGVFGRSYRVAASVRF